MPLYRLLYPLLYHITMSPDAPYRPIFEGGNGAREIMQQLGPIMRDIDFGVFEVIQES